MYGRGWEDHFIGYDNPPKLKDQNFLIWRAGKNQVISCLFNTMITEIGEKFLLRSTTKEI